MLGFLNSSNFFYAYQYGFRHGTGTDIALIETTDLIYRAFDNQKYVCGLFLDLRKAFDSIDYDLLLKKLYMYGFRGVSYNLLASYLDNRQQFVEIEGIKSAMLNIKCGVPQGSVLGPLLFLIFINDIAQLPIAGKIRMFADDTAIFYESKDCAQCLVDMKNDIDILIEFFNVNKLTLNLNKSKFIIFHSPYLPSCESLTLQDSHITIERVDKFKYLGIILDKHLSWVDQINSICLKASPFLFLIRKLASFVPIHVLKMIYFSFIHTRFYFAISAFGSAAKTKVKKLQIMQNKCLKSIYKLPSLFPTIHLYSIVAKDVLPINALFELQLSIYMYKYLNVSYSLSNLNFDYVSHRYETRTSDYLSCQNIRTEFGRKSMSFIGPYVYNKLPNPIKSSENILQFKKVLKAHFRNNVDNYL